MDLTEEASAGELDLELEEVEEEEAEHSLQEDLRVIRQQAQQPDSSRNGTGTGPGGGRGGAGAASAAVDTEWARRVRGMLRVVLYGL